MANRFKAPIRAGIDTAQLKSLIDRLTQLDAKAAKPAIKKGVNEVTKRVLRTAKDRVPRRSGMLGKSLGRTVKVLRSGAAVIGVVKPRSMGWVDAPPNYVQAWKTKVTKSGKVKFYVPVFRGKSGKINPVRYAHLAEFGRVAVAVRKKKVLSDGSVVFGTKVKAVSPHPFMRPAWAENEPAALGIVQKELGTALIKYWLQSRAKVPPAKRMK